MKTKDLTKAIDKLAEAMPSIIDVPLTEPFRSILNLFAERIAFDQDVRKIMNVKDKEQIKFLSRDLERKFGAAVIDWIRAWKK